MPVMPSTISPTRPASWRAVSWRCASEHEQPAPEPRDQHDLNADDRAGDEAERDALHQDEHHGGDRLADEIGRLDEGVADEAAERLHLVLHHGGDFGGAQPPELRKREAQQRVDELVAHAAQHPLAEPALEGGDVELEVAVHQNEEQEQRAEVDQHRDAAELEPVEKHHLAAAEQPRLADRRRSASPSRCPSGSKSPALDRAVYDRLRQVEGEKVEGQRHHHDDQKPNLVAPGMPPCVAKNI